MKNTTQIFILATFIFIIAFTACKKKKDSDPSDTPSATNIPALTTLSVSGITDTSATAGGNITSNGDGNISSAGVCWDTIHNPTINNVKSSDYQNASSFVSQLKSLIPGRTYYARAYATNEFGTAYGNEISLVTTKSAKWVSWTNGLGENAVNEIITSGNDLYAATSAGVYKSSGGQNNWTLAGLSDKEVNTIIFANGMLFAGTQEGAFSSSDGGNNWNAINNGFYANSPAPVIDLASSGTKIYANTFGAGWEEIYMSSNNGQQWVHISNQSGIFAQGLEVINNTVYLYNVWQTEIYSSDDDGASWNGYCNLSSIGSYMLNKLTSVNGTLYACTNVGLYAIHLSIPQALYTKNTSCSSTEIHKTNLYIGLNDDIQYSSDNGASWIGIKNGLKRSSTGGTVGTIQCLRSSQGILFAGTSLGGIFKLDE